VDRPSSGTGCEHRPGAAEVTLMGPHSRHPFQPPPSRVTSLFGGARGPRCPRLPRRCNFTHEAREDPMQDQERIRRRAHEIWEREGRPEGRHKEHWAQARRDRSGGQRRLAGGTRRPRRRSDGHRSWWPRGYSCPGGSRGGCRRRATEGRGRHLRARGRCGWSRQGRARLAHPRLAGTHAATGRLKSEGSRHPDVVGLGRGRTLPLARSVPGRWASRPAGCAPAPSEAECSPQPSTHCSI
jgi:hypothetical protein